MAAEDEVATRAAASALETLLEVAAVQADQACTTCHGRHGGTGKVQADEAVAAAVTVTAEVRGVVMAASEDLAARMEEPVDLAARCSARARRHRNHRSSCLRRSWFRTRQFRPHAGQCQPHRMSRSLLRLNNRRFRTSSPAACTHRAPRA